MNFSKILSTTVKPKVINGLLGNDISTAGSKYSGLIKSISRIGSSVKSRLSSYDALCEAMTMQQSMFADQVNLSLDESRETLDDNLAEEIQNLGRDASEYVEVTSEEAQAMLIGIDQSAEMLKAELEDQSQRAHITLTSSSGLVYEFVHNKQSDIYHHVQSYLSTAGGAIPFIVEKDGKYAMLQYLKPVNSQEGIPTSVVDVRTIYDRIRTLCLAYGCVMPHPTNNTVYAHSVALAKTVLGTTYNSVYENVEWVAAHFAPGEIQQNTPLEDLLLLVETRGKVSTDIILGPEYTETFTAVTTGLVISSEINSMVAESCDAVMAGKVSSFMSLSRYAESKHSSVKIIWNKLTNAFTQNGLKGFISQIISLFSTTASIDTESGILVFTDNSNYVPREYIAGLVGTIVSTVVSAAGMIITAFAPLVGIVLAVAGSLIGSIFNSFKGDYSNTKCSLYDPATVEEAFTIIQCAPVIFGTWTRSFDRDSPEFAWYSFYADRGETTLLLDVPGGLLLLGPGSLDNEGFPTSINIEFHPSVSGYLRDVETQECFVDFWDTVQYSDQGSKKTLKLSTIKSSGFNDKVVTLWNALQGRIDAGIQNQADGHLNADDDKLVYHSMVINVFIFMVFCMSLDSSIPDDDSVCLVPFETSTDHSLPIVRDVSKALLFYGAASPLTPPSDHDPLWSEFITAITLSPTLRVYDIRDISTGENDSYVLGATIGRGIGYTVADHLWFDVPTTIPFDNHYALIAPKYNSRTFWAWIAFSSVATAVATAAVVFASVKWSKWKKAKRASNVAKASQAQSTYQSAIAGEKYVYNPQTKQYDIETFDVNSPEGKEYINSCFKDYKKVALTNNLWANVIGGSKYDVSSFWGEKDDSGDSGQSVLETIQSAQQEVDTLIQSDVDQVVNNPVTDGFTMLYKLVTGSDYTSS